MVAGYSPSGEVISKSRSSSIRYIMSDRECARYFICL
jgi:hypothetical protein